MKVLVAVANHGKKNAEYLDQLILTYMSMSHDVDLVVLSDVPKDLGPQVEVHVGAPTDDPRSLPFAHQKIFAERLEEYDLFVYSEDDTLLTEAQLEAFCQINDLLPDGIVPGFFRHETRNSGEYSYSSFHTAYHWEPASLRLIAGHEFATFTNAHSAIYVVTAAQLQLAIDSGGYLVEPHAGEYTQMVSAATDIYTQCGLERVMCVSRIDDFVLHHLPNIYLDRLGIDARDFKLQIDALRQVMRGEIDGETLLKSETEMPTPKWHRRYFDTQTIPGILPLTSTVLGAVLSVGCTDGEAETKTFPNAARIVGVPVDNVVGSLARDRGIETVAPDFDRAIDELPRAGFDVIWLDDVVHRLPNPPARLAQLKQLLAPGGMLIATAPNLRQHALKKRLGRTHRPLPARRSAFQVCGVHYTTEATIGAWLETAGLRIVDRDACLDNRQWSKRTWSPPRFIRRWYAATIVMVAQLAGDDTAKSTAPAHPSHVSSFV